ncbi:FeoA family protein [Acidocella sp.]|uniref:FeoA family protein n=1 Tax=Acidocella sp. TaxID=50710 RepID=UPI003D0528B4
MLRQDAFNFQATGAQTPSLALGEASPGFCGIILAIDTEGVHGGLPADELERRLLEMGLVEGAKVEVRHQGLIRRDPIAVRINDRATFALRRREAAAIFVVPEAG